MAAATGPPNRAEIAENVPAVESTLASASPILAKRAATRPTIEPRAKSGASGPSTAPNASEPIAARMTPGACEMGVGATAIPPSGSWPPSPGSNVRAARTIAAPASGRPTTRYQGGPDAPRCSGRSTQNQCSSSWTAARKSAAASAAGIPIRAPRPTRRRARSPDMGEAVSGELTSSPTANVIGEPYAESIASRRCRRWRPSWMRSRPRPRSPALFASTAARRPSWRRRTASLTAAMRSRTRSTPGSRSQAGRRA